MTRVTPEPIGDNAPEPAKSAGPTLWDVACANLRLVLDCKSPEEFLQRLPPSQWNPPSVEQVSLAMNTLRSIGLALDNADSSAWDSFRVGEAHRSKLVTISQRTRRALALVEHNAIRPCVSYSIKPDGTIREIDMRPVLHALATQVDSAFFKLSPEVASRIARSAVLPPRGKKGGAGARGPMNVLARFAIACGALDVGQNDRPSQRDVSRVEDTFKRRLRDS